MRPTRAYPQNLQKLHQYGVLLAKGTTKYRWELKKSPQNKTMFKPPKVSSLSRRARSWFSISCNVDNETMLISSMISISFLAHWNINWNIDWNIDWNTGGWQID